MKIEKLNIHSYGKIKDKEIKFRNHINIIFLEKMNQENLL